MPLDYLPIMKSLRTSEPPRECRPVENPAWSPLSLSLREMSIALITSGAIREANQKPFPFLGDASYRRITSDPNFTDLRVDHRNRFGAWARRDPETVFPRQALRTLADQGIIGSVAPFHFSISGGIELYGEIEEKLAPALVQHLKIGRTDLAVFLPY